MSRSSLLLVAAVLTAGTVAGVGCVHCDICDDFPYPCNGPNCYGNPGPAGPGRTYVRPVGPPAPVNATYQPAPGAAASAAPATAPPPAGGAPFGGPSNGGGPPAGPGPETSTPSSPPSSPNAENPNP